MPSRTVETTIRNIYLLAEKHTGGALTVDQIANSLEVAPATASSIINGLSEAKLVEVENDQTVRLTEEGHKLGIGMVRRHRLLEYCLVEVLKMDWSEVHDEAEALEH
ncbi:MAG: metal-dependent transcriptional regulator, partial [Puniceicoccales bacterium]